MSLIYCVKNTANPSKKVYSREVYQRVHGKIEEDITVIYKQIADLEKDRQVDVRFIEEIFALARDIYGTYLASPNQLKRGYIKLFFEHLYVSNKRIAKITYNPLFATLLKEQKIMMTQKAKETIVASVIKPKPILAQNMFNTPAEEVILRQVKLRIVNNVRTILQKEEGYVYIPDMRIYIKF